MSDASLQMTSQSTVLPAANASVGDLICRLFEHWGVTRAFGVISIHNMPILDPMGVRGKIAFTAARGEAGAVNMADAYARVSNSLGVAFTSTGTAAGNAAGAMVEALTAGSPVLHITGQIELEHLGKNRAFIHEAPAQRDMLEAVSKGVFQLLDPADTVSVLTQAASLALSAPRGPVSIEIPVDVQAASTEVPAILPDLQIDIPSYSPHDVTKAAALLKNARRPMILLGGGARGASVAATALADLGVGIVTSTNGRGTVPEDHAMTLGAFNCSAEIQDFYKTCDLMLVVGSRLRGNETWTYKLDLPTSLVVIDVDRGADQRCYPNDMFFQADSVAFLDALVTELGSKPLSIDPAFANDLAATRTAAQTALRSGLGPYAELVDMLQPEVAKGVAWVRDVTISNSTWGNRYMRIADPYAGVHALGGGIGQGLPMGIGAAQARPDAGAIVLSGDGGLNLCLGELATAAEEGVNMTLILMNDAGYGVIRNIQDDIYGGRKYYSNIFTPNFGQIAAGMNLAHIRVESISEFPDALARARALKGPVILEVDMVAIGPYPVKFAGPPKKVKS